MQRSDQACLIQRLASPRQSGMIVIELLTDEK
jgi:hypothetical protein